MNVYSDVRFCDLLATFRVIDTTAQADADASTTDSAPIAQLNQIIDDTTAASAKIGTLETNFLLLDDSFTIVNSDVSAYQTGWISNAISDANRDIDTSLIFEFDDTHDSMGFTIYFDDVVKEYPAEYTIYAYNGVTLLDSITVTDSGAIDAVEFAVTGYDSIVINFTKTAHAHRRIRVTEVVFGLIIQYSKDNLESASLLREIDNTSETLPICELTLNLDNQDKRYNLLNPSNLFQYLQDGQVIELQIGIGTGADNIEYADMGEYYFKSIDSKHSNVITQLTAQDLMMYLDKKPYTTGSATTVAFSAFVAEIVSNSGLSITTSIPAAVSALVINKNLVDISCRAALALACAAVCCVAYFDKSTLVITQLSATTEVDALDDDNMYESASIEIPERYNICEVSNDTGVLYTYNNVGARETALTLKVKNPCLTAGLATAFAQWRLAEENRKLYKIHNRGNPERDITDTVKVYDNFNVNNNIIITKQELIFDGGLEENLEGVY